MARESLVGRDLLRFAAGELRASTSKDDMRIEGLGAPYDSPTEIWSYGNEVEMEVYEKGCFAESINSDDDILSCWNHNIDSPLGRRRNKTLTVTDTAEGARYSVLVDPEDVEAKRIYQLVQRGTVYGSSVRFRVEDGKWDKGEKRDGMWYFTYRIERATMRELGPVLEPAYEDTPTQARNKVSHRDVEAALSYQEFLRAIQMPGA